LSSSRLNALITAIGVSLILENGGLLVFGSNQQFYPNVVPEKTIKLPGNIQVSSSQLAILVISLALMAILRYIVLYTRRGRAMRAISHDIEAAKLMGVDTDKVIAFTFALGSALAGAGGAMVGCLTHVKLTPLFGLQPGLKAFVAAVLGGAGNIPGAALGGIVMGIAEAFVAATGPISNYRDAIAFLLLTFVLLVKPAGLLGKNVAEKV
ncbi:MAG TPA: branched-chain amino acid ABC transporter permease, partial [Chthonomonadales bacterium]|nr:branched-chain amino acid ABC transporter permease [Chthonomonadales bacterium]